MRVERTEKKGFVKIFAVIFAIFIAYVLISSAFFILRYGLGLPCNCNKQWHTRTVYPEKPIIVQTNPNYLKDKLNVEPKSFPYKRVKLDPLKIYKVTEVVKLGTSWKYVTSFEIRNNNYVTLFNKGGTNLFFIVHWINESKPIIIRSSYEEAKYIGKITYESNFIKDHLFNNTYYKTKGEDEYYELNIKINSYDGSTIEGTLYHIYDFTTQEGYLGAELIYSVTAAGYFWVNYGTEVWVDRDVSHHNVYDAAWRPCWLNSRVIANNGPSASIRADGRASSSTAGLVANFELWATVSVDLYAEGWHDGGGNFYISYGWPCGP